MGGLTRSPRLRIVALVVGAWPVSPWSSSGAPPSPRVADGRRRRTRRSTGPRSRRRWRSRHRRRASRSPNVRQSLTTEAVHTACEALSSSSVDSINAVNDYVDGVQLECRRRGGQGGTGRRRAQPQRRSGRRRASTIRCRRELRDALNAWVDAARGVANAIAGTTGPTSSTPRSTKLNDVKTRRWTSATRHIVNLLRRALPDARVVRR